MGSDLEEWFRVLDFARVTREPYTTGAELGYRIIKSGFKGRHPFLVFGRVVIAMPGPHFYAAIIAYADCFFFFLSTDGCPFHVEKFTCCVWVGGGVALNRCLVLYGEVETRRAKGAKCGANLLSSSLLPHLNSFVFFEVFSPSIQ